MARRDLMMKDKIRLADWLRDNWHKYEGTTDIGVAREATADLGTEITPSQVDYYCKSLDIVRNKHKSVARHTITAHQVMVICQEIRKIQGALNIAPSAEFTEIMRSI